MTVPDGSAGLVSMALRLMPCGQHARRMPQSLKPSAQADLATANARNTNPPSSHLRCRAHVLLQPEPTSARLCSRAHALTTSVVASLRKIPAGKAPTSLAAAPRHAVSFPTPEPRPAAAFPAPCALLEYARARDARAKSIPAYLKAKTARAATESTRFRM